MARKDYALIGSTLVVMSISLLDANEDVNEARAHLFRALGDPTRLRIYQTIVEAERPMNVTEICEWTGCSPNLVSHHLKCLRNCGLVTAERDGRMKFYEVGREEGIRILGLCDECIRRNVESVLGCEIMRVGDDR